MSHSALVVVLIQHAVIAGIAVSLLLSNTLPLFVWYTTSVCHIEIGLITYVHTLTLRCKQLNLS